MVINNIYNSIIRNYTRNFSKKKNALNEFRQLNGYKNGTYIKIWNGKEDNVIMQDILEELEYIDYDEIIKALDSRYLEIN